MCDQGGVRECVCSWHIVRQSLSSELVSLRLPAGGMAAAVKEESSGLHRITGPVDGRAAHGEPAAQLLTGDEIAAGGSGMGDDMLLSAQRQVHAHCTGVELPRLSAVAGLLVGDIACAFRKGGHTTWRGWTGPS